MNFLIQIDRKGNIQTSTGHILKSMEQFLKETHIDVGYEYCSLDDLMKGGSYDTMLKNHVVDANTIKQVIPIGTPKFIKAFVKMIWEDKPVIHALMPYNVPLDLQLPLYAGRMIYNMKTNEDIVKVLEDLKKLRKLHGRWFVKDMYDQHSELNHFYDVIPDLDNGRMTLECRIGGDGKSVSKVFDYNFYRDILGKQISNEIPNIVSQWRILVTKQGDLEYQIKGAVNYKGDPIRFPKRERIFQFIEQWYVSPKVYAMDVMVDITGNTWILGCHDLIGCDMMGFNDPHLPWYLKSSWDEIRGKIEYEYFISESKSVSGVNK